MKVLKTISLLILGSLWMTSQLLADDQKCEAPKELDLKNVNALYTSFKSKDEKNNYTPCK